MARGAYPARLYQAVHRGNPGDVAYYRGVCSGARHVLELGCGAGRVSSALGSAERIVVGIDRDREQVALARARGVRALVADMRAFALGRRFDRIIAPYNTLYTLCEEDDLARCLACVRAHLLPEGRFVFDGYCADVAHREAAASGASTDEGDGSCEVVDCIEVGGVVYDVIEDAHWERDRQVVVSHYHHVPRSPAPAVSASIPQRYLLSHEIPTLLAEAGLMMLWIHGDFAGKRWEEDDDFLVVGAGIGSA